ncbi:MAG: hypothetical protein JWM58_4216 [Rhizobium sp.]|nr:hypothetical protein [Rhizobium sp.]
MSAKLTEGGVLSRLATTAAFLTLASSAHAHGSEASIVLLLPTGYYLAGAAIAVAASFLLLALLPAWLSARLATIRLKLGTVVDIPHAATSTFAFALLALLVPAGIFGTRDPVENPLPLMIWTIWWVCFTVLQAITGPLWPHLNPWTGPIALLRLLTGKPLGETAFAKLPERIGYRIAVLQFAAFAWFELIDPAPSDPDRLAIAIIVYWLFNLAGALIFSEREWMRRAEPFSIFFGLIGLLSIFDRRPESPSRTRIALVWPGYSLIQKPALPLTGVLFVLLALSTVSFDGLSRTFVWLSAIRVNPLEFPGRSAVEMSGTLGMVGMFIALSIGFIGAVALGCALAGRSAIWREASGRLIHSIVPIALAFQAAHYLTSILVDGQNVLIALSDPFSFGWNLFGTAHWHTTTSFLNTLSGVTLIFNTETVAIALGHIVGIIMAHLIALRMFDNPRQAVVSQIPLAALMVFYTAFGLWLLATPRI